MFEVDFPTPVLQKSFVLPNGRNTLIDFWFVKQKAAGEFDGLGKYLRSGWGWTEMQNTAQLARLLRQAGLPQAHKSAAV